MKLKFFNPENLEKNLKATVHKTGKLGFTVESAKKMDLKPGKGAAIGINEEDETDQNLYVIIHPNRTEGSFNVSKAGSYYYINTKALFDSLKIDYVKDSVVYDISSQTINNQDLFVLKRREKTKNSAKTIE